MYRETRRERLHVPCPAIGNNAQAGPSRLAGQHPSAGQLPQAVTSHMPEADVSPLREDSEEPLAKRARIKRSSKACRSCRSRKRKCGGVAPEPCPNCITAGESCNWDVEDGRSSAVRRNKVKSVKEHGGVSAEQAGLFNHDSWGLENLDWLSALGGQEGGPPPEPSSSEAASIPNPFDFAAFPTPSARFLSPANPLANLTAPSAGTYQHAAGDTAREVPLHTSLPTGWPSDVDPFELIMAFSSRMPEVEQTSVQDGISPGSDTVTSTGKASGNGSASVARRDKEHGGKNYVKVTWWRPHGQTAIAPGLKRMTLKVRVNDETASERAMARSPADAGTGVPPIQIFNPGGRVPSVPIMKHLCALFSEFFGSQYPFLDLDGCIADLEAGNGSVFLLNCIAATAARFSTHPSIALPGLQPHEYGNVFFETAKEMLGSMLAVPLRDTIVALLLLCHVGFANDSEAEEWMFAGMAVRLAIDLGIDREVEEEGISAEDRRLNRLVFWSVVLLDFALAFGTGRQPTLRVAEITQTLPTDDDLPVAPGTPRHPFPYACRMMLSYGRLIELLNSRRVDVDGSIEREAQKCKIKAIKAYASLPSDMRWDVQNLQLHHQAGRAPIYLQLHLWMHTIIASGHLTGTDFDRRPPLRKKAMPDTKTGAITPNGVAWRSSARTIGDILVLSDIVCPRAYIGLPFCNQAFYVAGSCYVKELEQERDARLSAATDDSEEGTESSTSHAGSAEGDRDDKEKINDLFWSIQATVSTENIDKLRKGLVKQTTYWSGVAWVAEALEQRIRGIAVGEIDLASVTEKLSSIASIPDAGLLHRSGEGEQVTTETSQVFDLARWLCE